MTNHFAAAKGSFSVANPRLHFYIILLFVAASLLLHCGEPEAAVFLDLSFVVAKHSFTLANHFLLT